MSATHSGWLAATCTAVLLAACGGNASGAASPAVPTSTAQVVRTDIVSRREVSGTLTYSGSYTVVNHATGVYTSLPAPGDVISRGQVLYRIDNRPIPLLYGGQEWRRLAAGVADGPDVQQLEQNLLALGFGNSANLIANGHFDAFDAAAVRRWQAALGLAQTGAVELGDAVYLPGPIRVMSTTAAVGALAQPGQPTLQATSPVHAVQAQLDVGMESLVKAGDAVTVTMPDGKPAAGTLAAIGDVAVTSQGPGGSPGPATVTLTITLADPSAGGRFDQAPVSVDITDTVHHGVLAVPVTALLAEPGGTYAVEVVDGAHRHLLQVTTGLFDDRGLVEVAGPDLREGISVEVPQT